MIGRVIEGGQPVGPNLLFSQQAQGRVHIQGMLGIPDIIQRVPALSRGPDLPGGVGGLRLSVGAQQLVGAVQIEAGVGELPVHLLGGLGVEVSAHDQGDLRSLGDVLQVLQEVAALGRAEPLPARAGLQVCDGDAEEPAGLMALERLCDGHLVGLELHGGQADVGAADQLEALLQEEHGAAVGPVVALHVQARRPRLGEEGALVAQAAEERLKGVEVVVDFLKAQDVGLVGQDLLQDEALPLLPFQGFHGALDEVVFAFPESWN